MMFTSAQQAEYEELGFVAIPNGLAAPDLRALRDGGCRAS
jgi:hypothetical protein